MLLANISTAHQVALHFPEQALLRRHEDPMERRLVAFAQRAERMGVNMDVSSGGAIQKSFDAIEDPHVRRLLEILSTKAMHSAKYFCAGMLDIAKYHHYALNVPLYTHFTSPIRRYADILVHRQLESVLAGGLCNVSILLPYSSDMFALGTEPKFTMDRDSVAKIAQQCNMYVSPSLRTLLGMLIRHIFTVKRSLPNLRRSNRPIFSYVCSLPTSLNAMGLSFAKLRW
jgi:protein SSD1